MLKKLPFLVAFLCLAQVTVAQTIVSTETQNRIAILEEFTGINCVFCPQGHEIAQDIKADNPDNFFIINVHWGNFAVPGDNQPDFRIPFGEAIDGQSGLIGYPAGTVNRQNFPGREQGNAGATAMNRNFWSISTDEVLAEESYVNLATEATLNFTDRTMSVLVESYYTGDSPEATNFLNVAILQNNTLGPQTGGNAGDEYVHQHRLIDLITGQWGEEITTTTAGTFVERTYEYAIPEDINGIPVELGEIEIVVYMAETTQLIISGNGTTPVVEGLDFDDEVILREISELADYCEGFNSTVTPSVLIQNFGNNDLTSLDITYNINGGTDTVYTWTGSLSSLQTENVELPTIDFVGESVNVINVSIPDDNDNENNVLTTSEGAAVESSSDVILTVTTDDWAEEVSWDFRDSNGAILIESEPFTQNVDDRTTFVFNYEFEEDCVTFNLYDAFGDGVTVGGNGSVSLIDGADVVIFGPTGDYGSGAVAPFSSSGVLGTDDNTFGASISLYPNPATSEINLINVEGASYRIFDITGRELASKLNIANQELITTSAMATGTYFMEIIQGTNRTTKKFVVTK